MFKNIGFGLCFINEGILLSFLYLQGLGKDQIFTHHGDRYMHNTISLYDQTFNRRYSMGSRNWDGKRMAWLPEASDHPVQG